MSPEGHGGIKAGGTASLQETSKQDWTPQVSQVYQEGSRVGVGMLHQVLGGCHREG